MRRVMLVLPDLRGGGAERMALTLARCLSERGRQVTIFLLQKRGVYWDEIPDGVRVVWGLEAARLRWGFPTLLWRLVREARRHDVIVGTQELVSTYAAWAAGRLTGKPVIGWLHTIIQKYLTQVPRTHALLTRFVYRRIDQVVCVSAGVRNALVAWFGESIAGYSRVIHNAFDAHVHRQAGAVSTGAEPDPSPGEPTLIAVGRLVHLKGFDLLIRAHRLVLDRGIAHRLVILGEGDARPELEALARDLGVTETLRLPGFVATPWEHLRRADVFVLSSRLEGFPMVLLEALAAGLPIVAADCEAGPREVLKGGELGILVRPEDPAALADALERILLDRALQSTYRQLGPARAAEFSLARITAQWETVLREAQLETKSWTWRLSLGAAGRREQRK